MPTILSPLPVQSFRDSNGNPLAGGLLYTYIAGTSTPQATYTDSTGGTPNTNPIVLNSRGEAQIWLTGALTYKFILQDSAANLIWSVDQISSPTLGGNPVSLASAATTDIGGQSSSAVEITGTTTITSFGTNYNGPRFLRFTGALVLTQAASLNLPGAANITTAAGDTCIAYPNQALNGWNVVAYTLAASAPGGVGNASITAPKLSGAQTGTAPIFGVRAWCYFSGLSVGTNAPAAGGNVTSITRNALGDYTVTFTTSMPSANYAPMVNMSSSASVAASPGVTYRTSAGVLSPLTTASFRFSTASAGSYYDPDYVFVQVIA